MSLSKFLLLPLVATAALAGAALAQPRPPVVRAQLPGVAQPPGVPQRGAQILPAQADDGVLRQKLVEAVNRARTASRLSALDIGRFVALPSATTVSMNEPGSPMGQLSIQLFNPGNWASVTSGKDGRVWLESEVHENGFKNSVYMHFPVVAHKLYVADCEAQLSLGGGGTMILTGTDIGTLSSTVDGNGHSYFAFTANKTGQYGVRVHPQAADGTTWLFHACTFQPAN